MFGSKHNGGNVSLAMRSYENHTEQLCNIVFKSHEGKKIKTKKLEKKPKAGTQRTLP